MTRDELINLVDNIRLNILEPDARYSVTYNLTTFSGKLDCYGSIYISSPDDKPLLPDPVLQYEKEIVNLMHPFLVLFMANSTENSIHIKLPPQKQAMNYDL